MTKDPEPLEEFSKEQLDQTFNEAIEASEHLRHQLASAAEKAGYSHQVLIASFPRYQILLKRAEEDPSLYPVVASGIKYVERVTIEFNNILGIVGNVNNNLEPVTNSTGTFSDSTDAAFLLSGIQETQEFEPFPASLTRHSTQEYTDLLKALDPSLSKSYEQVWQIYFGTTADRFRAALYEMRQVYDHFFNHLAPDDLVRKSEYWQPKKGKEPDQIYRSERIAYAAHTHINDVNLAETFAASAKQVNSLYEAANEAHNRGALNENSANKTILAMNNLLKDWLDALQ